MLDKYTNQQHICAFFKNSVDNNKVSHAYLIEENGNDGYRFVLDIVKYLLCNDNEDNREFVCNLIDNNNYPELSIIEPDGKELKKEQMIELQHMFSTKSIYGKYRICIIKEADKFNSSSANTILKFLEEPASNIIIFLLANDQHKVISTISSRCQVLTMMPSATAPNICDIINKKSSEQRINADEEIENSIDEIFDIVTRFEMHKSSILADRMIYKYRDNFDMFLNVILLIYQDTLNCKLDRKLQLFVDKTKEINYISSRLELNDIIKRINVTLEFLNFVNLNVNKDLIIDNYVISLEEGEEINV